MSIVRERTRDLIRIGLALAIIAVVALACSNNREPVTEEEKETSDATAFFLAGVFTVSESSFDDNSVFLENFRANYGCFRRVLLVMCTHSLAKKALTPSLTRTEVDGA